MAEFEVPKGAEGEFEKIWADRKSRPGLAKGFRWFSLLRRVPKSDGSAYQDGINYMTCTIWEQEEDFEEYSKVKIDETGPWLGFATKIPFVNRFLPQTPAAALLALAPRTVKWDAISRPVWVPGESTPGGARSDVFAGVDWLMPAEAFVAMSRISVVPGEESEFEKASAREGNSHRNMMTKVARPADSILTSHDFAYLNSVAARPCRIDDVALMRRRIDETSH